MAFSRRSFLRWAASVSTLAVASPRGTGFLPLRAAETDGYRSALLPSEKEVWDQLVWMAKLGPKYTGNEAHTKFVEFLATEMKGLGLEVNREHYTFPRWDAKRTRAQRRAERRVDVHDPGDVLFPVFGEHARGRRDRRARLRGLGAEVHAGRCEGKNRPCRLHHEHAQLGARVSAVGD